MEKLKFKDPEELFTMLNDRLIILDIKLDLIKTEIENIKSTKVEIYKKLSDFVDIGDG